MAQDSLDRMVRDLARRHDDGDLRRDILDRASLSVLRRPEVGGALMRRLCGAAEADPALADLCDLLAAALDAARLTCENASRRGDGFLTAVAETLAQVAREGGLGATHRLLLARIWARIGLEPPAVLELSDRDVEAFLTIAPPSDRASLDTMLDELFRDLLRHAEGDALGMHTALAETFPAMPPAMRVHVVGFAVARADPIHAELGCYWLLDPAPPIRQAAAAGLAARLAAGPLGAATASRLVVLRSWMPEDAARARIDRLLRDAMRRGLDTGTPAAPETVTSVVATLPDGGGAQSIAIALGAGRPRSVAMVLVKRSVGVKDAYVVPCRSAGEQRGILQRMVQETGAQAVPAAYLAEVLAIALGDGMAAGRPPAPDLIDVAARAGLTALRPRAVDTAGLIAGLAARERIGALSVRARGRLVTASAGWSGRHEIVRSWFEESDGAHAQLDPSRRPEAVAGALWTWLETRRDWWAHQIARGAALLEAAGHPDADSFAATAMALAEGRALRQTPVTQDVHGQTISAWLFGEPDLAPEAGAPEAGAPGRRRPGQRRRRGRRAPPRRCTGERS